MTRDLSLRDGVLYDRFNQPIVPGAVVTYIQTSGYYKGTAVGVVVAYNVKITPRIHTYQLRGEWVEKPYDDITGKVTLNVKSEDESAYNKAKSVWTAEFRRLHDGKYPHEVYGDYAYYGSEHDTSPRREDLMQVTWHKRTITRIDTLIVLPHVSESMVWEGRCY